MKHIKQSDRTGRRPDGRQKGFPTGARRSDYLAFLPAALEIQDAPPPALARGILWTIVAFFLVAVVWSYVGTVDIVAVAHGKIIPSGHVKVIQPLEIGVVRDIRVTEGQWVRRGEVLVALDPTASQAEQHLLAGEIEVAKLALWRTGALAQWVDRGVWEEDPVFPAIESTEPDPLRVHKPLLLSQVREYRARIAGLDNEVMGRRSEIEALRQDVEKLAETLPLVTKRAASLKQLVADKLVAEHAWLELEQARIERRRDLAVRRSQLKEADAALRQTEQTRLALVAKIRGTVLAELAEAERNGEALAQQYRKAQQRTDLRELRAPVSGLVQQLSVHTIGGVVTPAERLMVIVPDDQALEVEAWLANKDVGFVRTGQRAEVKVEAFPFTRHGVIEAAIESLSSDAVVNEKLGLAYSARVSLERVAMRAGDRLIRLTPGMAVVVEIKTGRRRLIEFFLAPLLRYRQESLRER